MYEFRGETFYQYNNTEKKMFKANLLIFNSAIFFLLLYPVIYQQWK